MERDIYPYFESFVEDNIFLKSDAKELSKAINKVIDTIYELAWNDYLSE